jgi:calcineurin-like phosphoesterase family protein
MARFYTADLHFWHANIIVYSKRPFRNAPQMNAKLIENWNSVVTDKDDIYIVGDFGFGPLDRLKAILSQLNGRKHLILGNHDNEKWSDYIRAGFASVQRYLFLNIPSIGPVGFAHDPSCCIVDLSVPWVCGHLHQQFEKMNNCVNAGVDVRNLTPVSEEDMIVLLALTMKCHMKLDDNAHKEFGPAYGLAAH